MDFDHSPRAQEYLALVDRFIRERVIPNEALYYQQLTNSPDHTQWRIPPIMEQLKAEAKALGLWNLYLPDPPPLGAGLDNRNPIGGDPVMPRHSVPGSTTAITRRSPSSPVAAFSRPKCSTATRPIPATPKCCCATARTR